MKKILIALMSIACVLNGNAENPNFPSNKDDAPRDGKNSSLSPNSSSSIQAKGFANEEKAGKNAANVTQNKIKGFVPVQVLKKYGLPETKLTEKQNEVKAKELALRKEKLAKKRKELEAEERGLVLRKAKLAEKRKELEAEELELLKAMLDEALDNKKAIEERDSRKEPFKIGAGNIKVLSSPSLPSKPAMADGQTYDPATWASKEAKEEAEFIKKWKELNVEKKGKRNAM